MLKNGETCWVMWRGRAHFAQVVFSPLHPDVVCLYCKRDQCCGDMRIAKRDQVKKLDHAAGVMA